MSTFLVTAVDGDRVSLEPYHLAAEMVRHAGGDVGPEVAAVVAEGRQRQNDIAAKGLDDILRRLRDTGYAPAAGALLINRAGWITDLLQYSLGSPEHPAVAEGLAVRDAVRSACARCRIELAEFDEKSLAEIAPMRLNLSPAAADLALKALGKSAGPPWRKEQKLACLSAWVVAKEGLS